MFSAKVWHRIRRGYYTFVDIWTELDAIERHVVLSHAVAHSLGNSVALSHVSGAIAHGIAVWNAPLDRVHVTRLDDGAARIEPDVIHHRGRCQIGDVVEIDGYQVLSPERCALEAASRVEAELGLVMVDSLLHLRLCDDAALMRQFAQMQHWPDMRHVRVPVLMADGRAESPGESRGRWLFRAHRLPVPDLQYKIYDSNGVLRGTSDWCWEEHKLLGEFDGKVKYGRLLKPGNDAGSVVFAEKSREDELREITDFRMIRLIWDDYSRPALTVRRIERMLRLAG